MSAEQGKITHQNCWTPGDTGKAMQEDVLVSFIDQTLKFAASLEGSSAILRNFDI
jgi:hypothetical protein